MPLKSIIILIRLLVISLCGFPVGAQALSVSSQVPVGSLDAVGQITGVG